MGVELPQICHALQEVFTDFQRPTGPKGRGKGKNQYSDGGKANAALYAAPQLYPYPGAPWNWPPLPLPGRQPTKEFGKPTAKGKGRNAVKGPKGGRRPPAQTAAIGEPDAAHDGEAARRVESELAVAKQEVQFYRSLETKGQLGQGSPQMQGAQERLRKAKEKALGTRSLPQQARSLQDRLLSIEHKMEQQRRQADQVSTQLCKLCDQYEAILDQHNELKAEREQTRIQLEIVQGAAVSSTPGLWKPVGRPSSLDKVFLQFQEQLRSLYPGLQQDKIEKLGASVTDLYQTAASLRPQDSEAADMDDQEDSQAPPKRPRAAPGSLIDKQLLGAGTLSGPRHFRPEHAVDSAGGEDQEDQPEEARSEPFVEGDPEGMQRDWYEQQYASQAGDEAEDDRQSHKSGQSGRSRYSISSRRSEDLPGAEARSRVAQVAARWAEFQGTSVRQTHLKGKQKGPAASSRLASHREELQDEESDF